MSELREKDVNFARKIISTVRHGGVWTLPKVGAIFIIDHHNKRIVLKKKKKNINLPQLQKVFELVGYEVVDKSQNVNRWQNYYSNPFSVTLNNYDYVNNLNITWDDV